MRKAKFVYLLVGIGLLIWVLGDIDVSAALARVAEIGALGIAAILFVYFL